MIRHHINVCFVSEAHLYDWEATRVVLQGIGYAELAGREEGVVKIREGPAAFVNTGFHFEKLDSLPRPDLPAPTTRYQVYPDISPSSPRPCPDLPILGLPGLSSSTSTTTSPGP